MMGLGLGLGLSRMGYRGNANPFARAAFFAPLQSSLLLTKGTGSATFTRATTATVVDFEGSVKLCKSGEARFSGARRVENLLQDSVSYGNAYWNPYGIKIVTDTVGLAPDGTMTASLLASPAGNGIRSNNLPITAGQKFTASIYAMPVATGAIFIEATTNGGTSVSASGTFALTAGAFTRIEVTVTAGVGNTGVQYGLRTDASGNQVYIWHGQLENVTGQSVQTASEYVSSTENSTGALGVKYFTTMPDGITPINSANSKFAYNCLSTGDNFSTPDAPANRITGNITLAALVAPISWTPATVQTVVSKDSVSAGGRSYALNIQPTTGTLRLNVSLDGSTVLSYTSTAGTGFAAGTKHAIGVERESATGLVRFYVSEDKVTWTQLGTTVAGTAGAIFAGNAAVQFGALASSGLLLDGRIYDSEIYSGLFCSGSGAALAVDFDPSNWASGTTWTAIDSGEVWTINGNARVYQGEWDAAGPRGYLAEGAATNLMLYSQSFNTAWAAVSCTVGADVAIAPDGSVTADSLIDSGVLTAHNINQSVNKAASAVVTFSVYVKQAAVGWAQVVLYEPTLGIGVGKYINLATGTIGSTTIFGVGFVGTNFIVSRCQNGWWRVSITGTTTTDTYIRGHVYSAISDSGGDYAGASVAAIYVWGAQLELGSFATSYIPTTTAAVTRNADVDTYQTAGNIDTTGSVYLEFTPTHAPSGTISLWGSYIDASNNTQIIRDATNMLVRKRIAGVNHDAIEALSFTAGTTYKIAARFGAQDQQIAIDGVVGTTYSNVTAAVIAEIMQIGTSGNGGQQPTANIRNFRTWTTQLTDAQLVTITS